MTRRREFTCRLAAAGASPWIGGLSPRLGAQPPPSLSPVYAESVAIVGLSADLSREFSLRVARFPPKGSGSLWAAVELGEDRHAAVLDPVPLGEDAAPARVGEPACRWTLAGEAPTRFERARDEHRLRGTASAAFRAHETLEPPDAAGTIPITIEASFESAHEPVLVRPGRWEVMGRTRATIRTPSGRAELDLPGKWHEQSGERPRFAPAFAYLNVQGDRRGLLAVHSERGDYGYLWGEGAIARVRALRIDPPSDRRSFRVVLQDGRAIHGVAEVRRRYAVRVEGQTRPGATVAVTSDVGPLVGHLNDWTPRD